MKREEFMNRNLWLGAPVVALALGALVACKKNNSSQSRATAQAKTPAPPSARAASAPAHPADVSGHYTIASASNPGGRGGYSGSVTITKHGDLYSVDWTIAHTPPYTGVGIVEGEIFGVGWGLGKAYGVAVYRVAGGQLKGKWATSSSGGRAGVEDLSGPPGLNGIYKITLGKDGDLGKPYTGNVTIKPAGAVYDVTWHIPGNDYSGVGILDGKVFTVGWGSAGKGAGVVVYDVGSGLNGKWAQPHGTQLGTEVLKKL
jgi:hypothetical protein